MLFLLQWSDSSTSSMRLMERFSLIWLITSSYSPLPYSCLQTKVHLSIITLTELLLLGKHFEVLFNFTGDLLAIIELMELFSFLASLVTFVFELKLSIKRNLSSLTIVCYCSIKSSNRYYWIRDHHLLVLVYFTLAFHLLHFRLNFHYYCTAYVSTYP